MYFEGKAIVVADSIHYHETYMQLKESYDYANNYYKLLQRRIFVEGQTPWPVILANYDYYWEQAKADIYEKYAIYDFQKLYSTDKTPSVDSMLTTAIDSTLLDSALMEQPVNDTLVLVLAPVGA